ncbi:hypothetical protein P8452_15781 [Trifolium repens]|nr:hypothetical protein P8452_15781 [Trifolium repens]
MLLHLNLTCFSVSLLFCFSPPVAVLLPPLRLPPTSANYKSSSISFLCRCFTVRAAKSPLFILPTAESPSFSQVQ